MNNAEIDELEERKNVSLSDVHQANSKLQILLRQLPKTAEDTLTELDEIKTGIPSILEDEIDNIINRIETTFENAPMKSIERESDYEKDLYDLKIRLETYIKLTSFQETWEKIDERLSRIDTVFPPSYFDFRAIKDELDEIHLPNNIIKNINSAIEAFEGGRFFDTVSDCGHCAKATVDRFCELLKIECDGLNFYPKINTIKKYLEDNSLPPAGLEWYVIFLISVVHWLRNAEAHREESEIRIPPWMDDYRRKQIKRPENARVALVCTLQAAKELQKLIEINKYSESQGLTE